jgi:peroxiredoxin
MSTQTEQQKQTSNALQPGTTAPNFTLRTTPNQSVSLDQFKGNPVVLLFYPADFSPVCGDEVSLYNEILPEFQRLNAKVIGISVDGVWCHLAFSKHKNLRFPLLSDFEPKGNVAQKYGVYRKNDGVTERALFLVDKDGIIRYSYVSPIGVNPGADGILKALESLPQSTEQKRETRT